MVKVRAPAVKRRFAAPASADARDARAALLVIGDEILSGRTQDVNLAHLAQELGAQGIELCEARVVRDVEAEIVAAINALRQSYAHVFTTGGIGPTHDDITAASIARAFGVKLVLHAGALERVRAQCEKHGLPLNAARRRMARTPEGATLIDNALSGAPGFRMDNVYVLAGVPAVMRAMLTTLLPQFKGGQQWRSVTIEVAAGEGRIAALLARVQKAHTDVRLGSYPFFEAQKFGVRLVLRSQDARALRAAESSLRAALTAADLL